MSDNRDRLDRDGVEEVKAYDVDDNGSSRSSTSARTGNANDLSNKSPDEIRDEIEDTRERLSEDLDELTYRLSPERAKEEVQERLEDVQEAVAQTVRNLTDAAIGKAEELLHGFEKRGQTLLTEVEDRPVASSLTAASVVAAGVGWVIWQQVSGDERNKARSSYRADTRTGARTYASSEASASYDGSSYDTFGTGEAAPTPYWSDDEEATRDATRDVEARTPFWSAETDAAAEARARAQRAKRQKGGFQTFVKDNAVPLGIGATVAGVAAAFFALRDRQASQSRPRRRALPPPGASTFEADEGGSNASASAAFTSVNRSSGSHATTRAGTESYSPDADEKYFEKHFETHYESGGGSFSDYQAAYLFGTSLAEDDRYLDLPWDEVAPEAKRRWEEEYIDPWETRKEAVQYGYDRGRMDASAG